MFLQRISSGYEIPNGKISNPKNGLQKNNRDPFGFKKSQNLSYDPKFHLIITVTTIFVLTNISIVFELFFPKTIVFNKL